MRKRQADIDIQFIDKPEKQKADFDVKKFKKLADRARKTFSH